MLLSLIRLCFVVAATFAFVMAVLPQPPALPAPDKMQHMLAFFTLALLGSAAYPRISPIGLAVFLCGFGALIEFAQMVPALNRDADFRDWTADVLAAVAGLLVVHAGRRLRGHLQPAIGNR